MNRLLGIVAAVVAPLAFGGCIIHVATVEETRELSAPHVAASSLRVNTENGSITVTRAEREDVAIRAEVRARSRERLDQVEIVAAREADGTLGITAVFPGRRRNNEGCSFEVEIPDATGVDLSSSNGSITLERLRGKAILVTSNGEITVRGHAGDIAAESSNGRIELLEIGGAADADTSNGDIRVELSPESGGPVRADSSNGSITLILGPAFSGTLECGTSNGSVTVDGTADFKEVHRDRTHARIVIGDSTARSNADTSNGGVRVVFAR